MKLLRETIRKLIRENQSRYDKIANMVCSEKIDQIDYALQLAHAAEYIGEYTYEEETHYDSRTHTWMFHEWDEAFLAHLQDRIKEITLFRRSKEGIENVKTWESGIGPNGTSAAFRLLQYPPYE